MVTEIANRKRNNVITVGEKTFRPMSPYHDILYAEVLKTFFKFKPFLLLKYFSK